MLIPQSPGTRWFQPNVNNQQQCSATRQTSRRVGSALPRVWPSKRKQRNNQTCSAASDIALNSISSRRGRGRVRRRHALPDAHSFIQSLRISHNPRSTRLCSSIFFFFFSPALSSLPLVGEFCWLLTLRAERARPGLLQFLSLHSATMSAQSLQWSCFWKWIVKISASAARPDPRTLSTVSWAYIKAR